MLENTPPFFTIHAYCVDLPTLKDETKETTQAVSGKTYPQILLNVEVTEKRPIEEMAKLSKALKEIQDELEGCGRAFIRYSGTEALARITVEGKSETEINNMAESLAEIIREEIGV